MSHIFAALLAVLLALEAPCSCAAKQLGYAVLLSEGPDQPNAAGQTVAWGSYHITITGEGGMMGCSGCCSAAMLLLLALSRHLHSFRLGNGPQVRWTTG